MNANTIRLDVFDIGGTALISRSGGFEKMAQLPPPGTLNTNPGQTIGKVPDQIKMGYRWAAWFNGSDNWPAEVRRMIEQVPIAGRTINQLVAMLYGNGLGYYRNKDMQEDPTTAKRAFIPGVDAWLKSNRIHTEYLPGMFTDFRYTWNAFSELVFSRDKRTITNIYRKTAEHCRLSEQHEDTGRSHFLLFSPDFTYNPPAESRISLIPLYQWDIEQAFLDMLPGHKMAWHCFFPTPGKVYYARPYWVGLFEKDGWMDASMRVPKVVNAMMNNQITLKYQILIPEDYFRIRHQNWDQYTDDDKSRVIDARIVEWNNALKGEKNAFASIATVFKNNPVTGEALGKIEIIALDDKIKRDAWVPTSETADAQIVQGLGLHPSQVGLAPQGGKMGAGSGSDQRETYNLGISLNNIEQQIILEPLNWIAKYNAQSNPDWDITFFIDHTYHTTSNIRESGLDPSATTITVE